MRKSIAKFVPVIAISALAAACTGQITQPDDTAGIAPIDTLLARAPIDTFFLAQRAGLDTFYTAQRAPIDTFYLAQRAPVDTFASARIAPVDTLY